MHLWKPRLALAALLPLLAGSAPSSPPGDGRRCGDPGVRAEVLLREDFEGENDQRYALNYTDFERWEVVEGTVDLVGTPPFDDFLPRSQGMYVDLDGSAKAAGTLRTRARLELGPGRYRLEFKMSGTPRPNQPPNTVIVSLGGLFRERITLESYAPLQTYVRTIRVSRRTRARLSFAHLGGDDYGNFIDDIRLERLCPSE
ncbi:MAG TPA: hypothetical protein VFT45_00705 [Longimicrobium sp.]|nr:hypothetical protein [Longimicrobium sp.]